MMNTIYALKNKINNKIYIGQTWTSLKSRWSYGCGYRGCHKIDRAIKKLGKENFYYEILTFCSTQETANAIEEYFIIKFDSIKNGYNIDNGGIHHTMKGRKHSEKTRQKISKARTGKYVGENNSFYGKYHSEESKLKLSKSLKQQYLINPPITGRVASDETKKKISEAGKGKRKSPKTEFKIGRPWNPTKNTKLNLEIANSIREDHCNGMNGINISIKYNISKANVSRIINNKMWVV